MTEQANFSSLADELLHMAEVDQRMRLGMDKGGEWDDSVDVVNTARLKEILDGRQDWLTISEVGSEASHAAWLLAQHADADPEFQTRCLQMMKAALDGEVSLANIAYLEDRVRVNTGQPQLYGTQFKGDGSSFIEHPIEDREHLESRRKAMGLVSFDENKQRLIKIIQESAAPH